MILSGMVALITDLATFLASVVMFFVGLFFSKSSENENTVVRLMPGRGRQMMVFARNFLKNPKQVASIVPSSSYLTQKLLAPIDWEKAKVIVEYGPGIGNISLEILQRMRPDAKLVLIELNADMAAYLESAFKKDDRVISLNRSAEETVEVLRELGIEKADYIVSGIPFSMLPPGVGDRVVRATWEALRMEGIFLIYQYRRTVRDALFRVFSKVDIHFAPINIPPAHVYYAHRT